MIDKMKPLERKEAIKSGGKFDRYPCLPFMSEFKAIINGISIYDFWHVLELMDKAEIETFNRFNYDRIVIGPNTRGITDALVGIAIYPIDGVPYIEKAYLTDYSMLDNMKVLDAFTNERISIFLNEAKLIKAKLKDVVEIDMSIGGPFTIASQLRGVEKLLRDCRKCKDEVHRLLR